MIIAVKGWAVIYRLFSSLQFNTNATNDKIKNNRTSSVKYGGSVQGGTRAAPAGKEAQTSTPCGYYIRDRLTENNNKQ